MNSKNLFSLFAFAFFGLLIASGCEQDPCKGVVCENDGVCVNANCICLAGYEGDNCEIESRTKFVGNYQVMEMCDGNDDDFACRIQTSPQDIQLVIHDNFFNLNQLGITTQVYGEVLGTDVTIPQQDHGTLSISGSGEIDEVNGLISYLYYVTEAGTTLPCVAVFSRQ